MHVVRHADHRITTTPNATMTTLASPTLGGGHQSLWLVEMGAGTEGPDHAFEGDVLWSVTAGQARLRCGDLETVLAEGDTAVLPGGVLRRIRADDTGFTAVVTTVAPGNVTRGDGTAVGVPDWVA